MAALGQSPLPARVEWQQGRAAPLSVLLGAGQQLLGAAGGLEKRCRVAGLAAAGCKKANAAKTTTVYVKNCGIEDKNKG